MRYSVIAFAGCCFIFLHTSVHAQKIEDSVRYIHAVWRAEQRKQIMAHLQLTDAEKPGFGPVYYAYCNAIEYLEVEYAQIVLLLENYRLDHDNLKAQVFYKRMLRNDYLLARVRKQFFKKFCTVIPSAQASEFMRLDHSLRSAFRNSIQKDTSFTMKPRGSLFSTNKQRSFP